MSQCWLYNNEFIPTKTKQIQNAQIYKSRLVRVFLMEQRRNVSRGVTCALCDSHIDDDGSLQGNHVWRSLRGSPQGRQILPLDPPGTSGTSAPKRASLRFKITIVCLHDSWGKQWRDGGTHAVSSQLKDIRWSLMGFATRTILLLCGSKLTVSCPWDPR